MVRVKICKCPKQELYEMGLIKVTTNEYEVYEAVKHHCPKCDGTYKDIIFDRDLLI